MQIPKFSSYRFDNKEEVSTNVELLSRNFNNNFDMLSGTLSSLKSTVSKTNKYMQDLPVITGEEQDPNGNYTGKAGTIYRNIRGGVGVTLWVKETEEDVKTGWAVVNTLPNAPIGSIIAYAGASIPVGYLNCDGSAVSRTVYADLYTAIGTTWGAGDGSTTFNIPDLRSATLRGVGTPTLYTSNTAITLAQIIDDKFQEHKHKYAGVYNYAFKAASGTAVGVITSSGQTSAGETTGAGYDTYRVGAETTGKARGVYYIIKALSSSTVSSATLPAITGQYAYVSPILDLATTSATAGYSNKYCKGQFAKTSDGTWLLLNFKHGYTITNGQGSTFTLTGVTFATLSGASIYQAGGGCSDGGTGGLIYVLFKGATGNVLVNNAVARTAYYINGSDIILASKPTGYGLPD